MAICPDAETDAGEPDATTPTGDAGDGAESGVAPDGVAPDGGVVIGPNDVFVDVTLGLDTNTGKSASPFKTLYKAVSVVPSGSNVWVVDGAYDATNQASAQSIVVPDGVTVRAVHTGQAVINGLPLTLGGASGGLAGLVLDHGSSVTVNGAADAGTPTVSITDVQFKNAQADSSGLGISGSTKVLLTNPSISGPLRSGQVTVGGAAELVITGGTIDSGGTGAPGFGAALIIASGTSKLTLDGVTVSNSVTPGVGVAGSSSTTPVIVTLKGGTVFDNVGSAGNCAAYASIILSANASLTDDGAQIKNGKGGGICVRNGTATHVTVAVAGGAVFANDGSGIVAETGQGSEATMTIDGASFTSNTNAGISWSGSGSIDVHAATFTGNGEGLELEVAAALAVKVRASTLSGSTGYGVQAFDSTNIMTLDLGTAADPGMNTLTGNTTAGIRLAVSAAETVNAVGNTWTAAQNADASGHYAAATTVMGPATGANYHLDNATTLNL